MSSVHPTVTHAQKVRSVRVTVMKPMRALFLSVLLVIPTATAQWLGPTSLPEPTPGQLRGVWVDAFGPGFKTPAEVDTLIADAKAMNLNALFVQAVRRGDCYCLRSSLPVSDDPALAAGFDPLETLIARAHAADLQVHAWVVTLALWGAGVPPSSPDHAYNRRGPDAAESWLNVRYDGVTRPEGDVYLDPGVPAVSDYLAEAVVSLVENYRLDGLTFDRLRYPDFNGGVPSWGYNPVSLARFAAETGGSSLPHPTDETWTAWRREQVSLLERRLYLEAKRANPALWVGAATVVYGAPPQSFRDSHAYSVVLQDWAGWLGNGFLDLNLPMNYKKANTGEAEWFGAWNRFAGALADGAATAVAAGVYRNSPAETRSQLSELPTGTGWVGYSYRTPSEGVSAGWQEPEAARALLAALLTAPGGPFATPQAFGRPPPVTALLGRVEAGEGGRTVELLRGDRVVATARTDASGGYGFVLKGSDWLGDYRLRLTDGVAVPAPVTVGQVARAPTLTHDWYTTADSGEDADAGTAGY